MISVCVGGVRNEKKILCRFVRASSCPVGALGLPDMSSRARLCRSTCSRMAATSAYRIAEKAYKRDGKRPNAGLSEEQLKDLLDFDECALPNPFFTAFV